MPEKEKEAGLTPVVPTIGMLEWFRPGEYDQVEAVLNDMKELGVQELRTGISWADWLIPSTKAWYDWLIPRLAAEVNVLPCFLYTPPSEGIAPKTSAPPRTPKAYADFLDLMITEYGQYFEWVELWNEPNNLSEYDWKLDPNWKIFGEMVGGAAYWAKQRGKKTVLGGMSPVDTHWLELMFGYGVMAYIDVVGIHGFPGTFDASWEDWSASLGKVQHVLDQHGSPAKIWITEAGFSTWHHDEARQCAEMIHLLKQPVEKFYWYAARDLNPALATIDGFHLDEREYHFGLKRVDGTPKLLYRLWAAEGAVGLLQNESLVKPVFIHTLSSGEPFTLITGGAGFIGTNLAKQLLSEGKKVRILDNLSRPGVEWNLSYLKRHFRDRLEVVIADVRDPWKVQEATQGADEVFHFAAQVAVTTSLVNPAEDFEINALGTLNVLNALRMQNPSIPIVYTSTNKVYGGLEDLSFSLNGTRYKPDDSTIKQYGVSEERALDFHSPYGCSKGAADQYVIDYARSYNLPAVVFRMSCIYGPHQFGTEDQGWVAHFLIKALEGQPITIYGDGKQVRDILFVEDLVRAFKLAVQHIELTRGQAYNMGGGITNTVSLLEIVRHIEKISGNQLDLRFDEWRVGDQRYYVSDIRKFSQTTGWTPRNNVLAGVEKLYSWLCEERGFQKPVVAAAPDASLRVASR